MTNKNKFQGICAHLIIYLVSKLYYNTKYITDDHMLTLSHICSGLIYSTFVLDLYGLIRHISCLIYIGPHCNVTVPLVQDGFIANGPLYGVSNILLSFIIEHDCISDSIVVFNLFSIFADVIFINLRLLLMTC